MFAFHGGLNDNLTNLWYLGLFTIITKVIYLFGCIQKLNTCVNNFYFFFGLKIKHAPLLQYLLPVGSGPSLNTCP